MMKQVLIYFGAIWVVYCSQGFAAETVLTNLSVVNVETLQMQRNVTLVIQDNKIAKLTKQSYQSENENAVYIDMQGKFAIPGLIDAHVHHATDPDGFDNFAVTQQRLQHLLRGGVTSVRDMGGDARALLNLKRLAEIDQIQSPDIYFSTIIGGEVFFADPRTISSAKGRVPGETAWMKSVNINSDFDSVVLQAKGIGATGIKVYASVPAEVLAPLYQAAKRHDLQVWSHASISPAKPLDSVLAGADVLSHVPDLAGEVIDNFRDWRLGKFDISDSVYEQSLNPDAYAELFAEMKQRNVIIDATIALFEKRKAINPLRQKTYEQAKTLLRLAVSYGVKIGAGTDSFADLNLDPLPPLYYELSALVNEGGLTPLQSIQSATLINAEALGIEDTHGSIKMGKIANLVLLNADPSADVHNTQEIAHVIKNGRFVFRGNDPSLPFVNAREVNGMLWLSGQLGNLPTTMTLAGNTIEAQMHQAIKNVGHILRDNSLDYSDVVKCTLMLADISEWSKANAVYQQYFKDSLPTRSAFGASGLALNAKVEIECVAQL